MGSLPLDGSMLAATARVMLVYGLVFVVVPQYVLPGSASGGRGRVLGDAILVTAAVMVATIALGVLGMADGFSLAVAVALGAAGAAWWRYRATWQRTLLLGYGRFLMRLETIAPPTPPVPAAPPVAVGALWVSHRPVPIPSPALRRVAPARLVAGGLAMALGVIAVGVRLLPILVSPAPASVEFYANLEGVKGLLLGAPVRLDGEWGLHALVLALSALSQVDPAQTLRTLGALSAGALTVGVYGAVRAYGGRRPAALVGAAVVAYGGALLPIPLARQVEGDALTLAAALAVAAVPSARSFLATGARRDLAVTVAAVVACGLTHVLAGVLLAAGLAVLLASRLVGAPPARRRAVGGSALGLLGGLGASAVAYRMLVETSRGGMVVFLSRSELELSAWPVALCLAAGAALALRGHRRRRPGETVAGATSVVAGVALGLAPGGAPGAAGAAAILAAGAVAVALGLLAGPLAWRLARHVRSAPDALATAAALAVLAAVLTQVPGAVPGARRPVEPSGFVRAFAEVQRAAFPFQWTVVGTTAQRIRAQGRGRFMDYDYFLGRYDPTAYDHVGRGALPTDDLFIFLERTPAAPLTVEELLPGGGEGGLGVADWVARYRARRDRPVPLTVFYQDDDVVVYRLTREAPPLLSLQASTSPLPPPPSAAR